MTTTRAPYDDLIHGITRLADDLAIVEDGVTVVTDDLAIVEDRSAVVADRAPIVIGDGLSLVPGAEDEVRPVLVDLRGRRSRAVRVLSLGAVTATAALLASIPGSLVLSARTQVPVRISTASAAFRGSAFADLDCDGVRSGAEAAMVGQRVDLVRNGVGVVATTWTDADGGFGFDGVARDADYRVRIARADTSLAPGAGTVLDAGTLGALATSSTVVVELPWTDAGADFALPPTGSTCAPAR